MTLLRRAETLGFFDIILDKEKGKLYGRLPNSQPDSDRVEITEGRVYAEEVVEGYSSAINLYLLENVFTSWLTSYETFDTKRWSELFSHERNLLAQAQWARFRDELEATMKAGAVGGGIVDSFDDIKRESLWRQRSGNGKKFL